jgi:hypothetical protein
MGEILPLGNQKNVAMNPTKVFFEKKWHEVTIL